MNNTDSSLPAPPDSNRAFSEELLPIVYEELRKLAASRLASEPPGNSLQPTMLVHDAYLRLVGTGRDSKWNGRGHFFAAAALAMERILIERARKRQAIRHGGGWVRVELEHIEIGAEDRWQDVLAIHEVLQLLQKVSPEKAELVRLRYFGGLTIAEAAEAMGISPSSADRLWVVAKVWLYEKLQDWKPKS